MKIECYKCKKKHETGYKYEEEIGKHAICDDCRKELNKVKKVEEYWDFFGNDYIT